MRHSLKHMVCCVFSVAAAAARRWRQQQALLASSCSCGLSCCVHSAGLRRPLQTLTRRSRCCWRRASPRRAVLQEGGGEAEGEGLRTDGRTNGRSTLLHMQYTFHYDGNRVTQSRRKNLMTFMLA